MVRVERHITVGPSVIVGTLAFTPFTLREARSPCRLPSTAVAGGCHMGQGRPS